MKSPSMIAPALLLAACAAQPSSPYAATARQCFPASQVTGYSMAGPSAVSVQVGANRFYHLELSGYCPNVDRARGIALQTTGGGSWICSGLDAELIVPDPVMGPQRCFVTAVHPISRADYLATRRR
jgi:hypothetical protein